MAIKRPNRTSERYTPADDEDEEFNAEEYMDDEEQEEAPKPRRRRPAPKPEDDEEEAPKPRARVRKAQDDDEDDEPAKPQRRVKSKPAKDEDAEFEDEDADEKPKRGTSLQSGWAAGKKAADEAPKGDFTNDFKFTPEGKLIKFLDQDGPFVVYNQHWIDNPPEDLTKKKSFPCLKSFGKKCPLCDIGSVAKPKFCFTVVEVNDEGVGEAQILTAGPKLFEDLAAKDGARTGPLHKHYYEVSRTGKGLKTVYSVTVVRKNDLGEEWGIDDDTVEEFETALADMDPLTEDAITVPDYKDLREIARAIA